MPTDAKGRDDVCYIGPDYPITDGFLAAALASGRKVRLGLACGCELTFALDDKVSERSATVCERHESRSYHVAESLRKMAVKRARAQLASACG